ncbi:hypothetical protein MITSMUL_05342 [Mitsuokella multacida DSM 20544]|uniref:Uncharacterized protein n=1 Tax=Mitsuokella multacida DSM 20544 TaxID=500635 RepID=C9KQ34_9FIRM|nr:hypothetical protein MITSMUL_05342 [Mitsuokella multacida DSM 20544]
MSPCLSLKHINYTCFIVQPYNSKENISCQYVYTIKIPLPKGAVYKGK